MAFLVGLKLKRERERVLEQKVMCCVEPVKKKIVFAVWGPLGVPINYVELIR
jgi:hypothetical protein